jgi:hypothetical protein
MPGGFFILPILVRLFPNFVPSVFRGKNYKVCCAGPALGPWA